MLNNSALEVINKWFEFTGFNGERKNSYTLDGFSYECEKGNLRIDKIISEYDNTGRLAALYCKKLFDKILLNMCYTAHEIFNKKREEVESIREMYNLFNADFMLETEKALIKMFNRVFTRLMTVRMIGESRENEGSAFLDHLEDVIDALFTMNFDLFLSGGAVGELSAFSTKISVVPTLTEALLKVESSPDGIYICYINGHNMEGYFTYILKSGGNILSANDRIDEHYPGEHRRSRTGRWAEDKQWNLFPYAEMVEFEAKGYKGKDTTATVLGELNIYELPEKAWMPLLVGAVLIYLRFKGRRIELPKKYVDGLQRVNLSSTNSEIKALAIRENSQLIAQGQLDINFDLQGVLKDAYGKDFSHSAVEARLGGRDKFYDTESGRGWMETGSFSNLNQHMVDLWGDGFVFDSSKLLATNTHLITDGNNSDVPFQEMVGTEGKMRLQAYFQVRKQLAEYMQKRIDDNFEEFGGVAAVKEWFFNAVHSNIPKICKIIFDNSDTSRSFGNWVSDEDLLVSKSLDGYTGFCSVSLNQTVRERGYWTRCVVNGKQASLTYKISFYTWRGLEKLVGGPLPKVIDGYVRSRKHDGNSNIDATDLVSKVHTPMETWGSFSYNRNEFLFEVGVAFSKSGFNKFIKSGGSADTLEFIVEK